MGYISGTVNNQDEFLDAIKNECVAIGYTVEKDNIEGSPNTRELIFTSNKGHMLGFKLTEPAGDNVHIYINAAFSYDSGSNFFSQPNSFLKKIIDINEDGDEGVLYMNDLGDIDYHITINDGKIAGTYLVQNKWFTFYLGKFNQYDTPANYPNALYVGGNAEAGESKPTIEFDNNVYNAVIGDYTGIYGAVNYLGEWQINNEKADYSTTDGGYIGVLPFYQGGYDLENLHPDPEGNIPLIPSIVFDIENGFYLGELEGLYATCYYGNIAGKKISIGTEEYITSIVGIQDYEETREGMLILQLT